MTEFVEWEVLTDRRVQMIRVNLRRVQRVALQCPMAERLQVPLAKFRKRRTYRAASVGDQRWLTVVREEGQDVHIDGGLQQLLLDAHEERVDPRCSSLSLFVANFSERQQMSRTAFRRIAGCDEE